MFFGEGFDRSALYSTLYGVRPSTNKISSSIITQICKSPGAGLINLWPTNEAQTVNDKLGSTNSPHGPFLLGLWGCETVARRFPSGNSSVRTVHGAWLCYNIKMACCNGKRRCCFNLQLLQKSMEKAWNTEPAPPVIFLFTKSIFKYNGLLG